MNITIPEIHTEVVMNIGLPEIILLSVIAINFCTAAVMHGRPKGNYNVVISCIDVAIMLALLYWGGFFA